MDLARVARLEINTIYAFKICLLLTDKKARTLTMIADEFGSKVCIVRNGLYKLIEFNVVELDRTEGHNKFYKLKN